MSKKITIEKQMKKAKKILNNIIIPMNKEYERRKKMIKKIKK